MAKRVIYQTRSDINRKTFYEICNFFNDRGLHVSGDVDHSNSFIISAPTSFYQVKVGFKSYESTVKGKVKRGRLEMMLEVARGVPLDANDVIKKYGFRKVREENWIVELD